MLDSDEEEMFFVVSVILVSTMFVLPLLSVAIGSLINIAMSTPAEQIVEIAPKTEYQILEEQYIHEAGLVIGH